MPVGKFSLSVEKDPRPSKDFSKLQSVDVALMLRYQPYLNSRSLSNSVVYEIEEKLRKNVLQTLGVLGDGKLHLIVLMTVSTEC